MSGTGIFKGKYSSGKKQGLGVALPRGVMIDYCSQERKKKKVGDPIM